MAKHVLRNLKILEVSSVDQGAGKGVRIMFMKRDGLEKIWKSNDDLPDSIKSSLPSEAQTVWRKVANDRLGAGADEQSAIKQAWTAVKNGWRKEGDAWVRKAATAWADSALHTGWDEAFDGEVVSYCKREFSAEQRQDAEDKGHAMPGGGFPIESESDLRDAIRAIGRAKNPAAAKKHIKEQAARLGHSDLIPDTWKRAPANDDIDIAAIKVVEKEEPDMTLDELKKLINDQVSGVVTESLSKVLPDLVTKAVTSAVKKLKPADRGRHDGNPHSEHDDGEEERMEAEKETDAEHGHDKDGYDEETKKALAIASLPASLRKTLDEADKNAKLVQKFLDERQMEDFAKRAVGMGLKKEDGIILQKAYRGDAASQKVLEERMASIAKAGKAQDETAVIFKEFGAGNGGESEKGASAYDQLTALATQLRKTDMTLTREQAFTKVITDPANAELAAQERQERMTKIHKLG